MAFIFNLTGAALNQPLFNAVGSAAAARTVAVAAAGRNAGPRRAEESADRARLLAQSREAERTIKGFSKLKVKQKRAVQILEKATDRLGSIKDLLLEARKLIGFAQDPGASLDGQRDLANLFDQLIGKLNLKAKGAGSFGTNLIGASIRDIFDVNDLEVQSKPGSLLNTVYQGKFLGSDYKVIDGNGDTFLPNLFGSSLVKFPNADTNDIGILLRNDDTVVFDSTTGALSITRNGDATPIFQGTLERKGLGVLSSYFYGNFQDAGLRDEALADVNKALSSLDTNIAIFESQLTRASVALQTSEDQIEASRKIVGRLEAQDFAFERRFELEEQKRQFIFEIAIQRSLSYNSLGGLPGLTQAAFFGFDI